MGGNGLRCRVCIRELRRGRQGFATGGGRGEGVREGGVGEGKGVGEGEGKGVRGAGPEIYDVVCVGGGPAGLSLLAGLRGCFSCFSSFVVVCLVVF